MPVKLIDALSDYYNLWRNSDMYSKDDRLAIALAKKIKGQYLDYWEAKEIVEKDGNFEFIDYSSRIVVKRGDSVYKIDLSTYQNKAEFNNYNKLKLTKFNDNVPPVRKLNRYVVKTKFVEGRTLNDVQNHFGFDKYKEIRTKARSLSEELKTLIYYSDFHDSNVMLDSEGIIKFIDLGC